MVDGMSDATIALDTPEQIGMWVLLSRRHQIQLHLKGMKVPGLVKWVKANLETHGLSIRTVRDCIVPVEYAIAQAGGEIDYNLVNVHVLVRRLGMLFDQGIYSNLDEVEAIPRLVEAYVDGELEIVVTLDEPRPATNEIMVPA